MQNPTILASGILGQTGESILRVFKEGGAGCAVTKSIGIEPRDGHGNPCALELDNSLINAMGLPNPGIDAFGDEIKIALKSGKPVIGSIFASTPEDFATLAGKMEDFGAHAVELNLSCPHAEKYGLEVGTDPGRVGDILAAVKSKVKIPVFSKISAMVPDIRGLAKTIEASGGDGIVAINTLKAMKIEPEIGKPVLRNVYGGLSGPAIKPVGVMCVFEISREVKIPVIGVGGITTGADAIEYFMAGASAIQIGSGVHYRGIDVFKKVNAEIIKFMEAHGYDDLSQLIGMARGV